MNPKTLNPPLLVESTLCWVNSLGVLRLGDWGFTDYRAKGLGAWRALGFKDLRG